MGGEPEKEIDGNNEDDQRKTENKSALDRR